MGLFFRGLEKDRNLDDPYFFPIYKTAMELELPICIHTGSGSPVLSNLFNLERHSAFASGTHSSDYRLQESCGEQNS